MKKMKRMQKTLALMLSIVVVCSCLMAVPVSANEAETPFINYSVDQGFDSDATPLTIPSTITTEYGDSKLKMTYPNLTETTTQNITYSVTELSTDFVVDFYVKLYRTSQSEYFLSSLGTTTMVKINRKNAAAQIDHVQLLISPTAKTITPYLNGSTSADTDTTISESKTYSGTNIGLRHRIRGIKSSTGYTELYYQSVYPVAATPKFRVLSANTTGAVVQFNTPVNQTSVGNMNIDGVAVASATDVSPTYDEANVYQLTFADAVEDNANHVLSVNGVTDLAGTALTMENQSFTLGVLKDPDEMSMYTLYGFDNEPMETDGVLVKGSDDNPMGWEVIKNNAGMTYNYSGNGALYLNIPKTMQNKRTQMWFNIDLTKDMIYDYRISAPMWNIYGINTYQSPASANTFSGIDGATSVSTSSTSTVGGQHGSEPNRYTIMVDTTGKTVKYYLNGVLKATETFTEEETVKAYNHYFVDSGNAGGNYKIDYYAEYEAAENAKIKVVDVPAANQVVVQFNQPVSLAELTEGLSVTNAEGSAAVNAITATDASSNYECPNTYRLTYETLPVGNYTVAANVKGLSDATDATNFGTAAFEVEAFTAEVATNGTESYVQANRALELTSEDGETVSTATAEADGKTYTVGMVALPKSYGENCYQINTVSLPAGDYTVTATPVAVDGNTLTNALTYNLTVTGEALAVGTPAIADGVLTVNATNNRNANQTFIVILAEYATDANGDVLMTQVAVDTVTAKAFAGEETHTMSLTPSAAAEGVTYTFRAFVWDNLTNMANLIDVE